MVVKKTRTKILWGRLIALCLAFVFILGGAVLGVVKLFSAIFSSSQNSEPIVSQISLPQSEPKTLYTEDWYLKLVNSDNPLEREYDIPLSTVDRRYASSSSVKLDSRAVESFEEMCEAAARDGVAIFAASAYRSIDLQEKLFENEIKKNLNANPGWTREQAEEKAATVVTRPGTSEHNLGLAVDINTDTEDFKYTDEYAWLKEHAAEYGFIERYPEDKTEITGIIHEPWHYRYVGVEDAGRINELGMCLEEYVDYLKQGGN